MKCLQHTDGRVIRVSESEAVWRMAHEPWHYVPRSVWKREVRDKHRVGAKVPFNAKPNPVQGMARELVTDKFTKPVSKPMMRRV